MSLPRCKGYPVEFDPSLSHELAIATGWLRPKIKVSAAFFRLALPFQAAVLMHEVGHIKCGHYRKRLARFLLPIFNVRAAARVARQHEIEADEYAARQGYGQSLAMLYRCISANQRGIPQEKRIMQPTTDYRIRRIMRAAREAPC